MGTLPPQKTGKCGNFSQVGDPPPPRLGTPCLWEKKLRFILYFRTLGTFLVFAKMFTFSVVVWLVEVGLDVCLYFTSVSMNCFDHYWNSADYKWTELATGTYCFIRIAWFQILHFLHFLCLQFDWLKICHNSFSRVFLFIW